MISRKLALLLVIVALTSCSVKEDYVEQNRTGGLYKRDYYDKVEYICLRKDSTYEYFTEDSLLTRGNWDYSWENGKSIIGLDNFDYSMASKKRTKYSIFSMTVKYSHAKKAVLLRTNPDDHFMDFVRIDSTSCIVKK